MSLAEQIRKRALWLRLLSAVPSEGEEVIDRETATRLAAQQIRDERRANRSALQRHSSTTEITVANSRQVFLARLSELAARIKASASIMPDAKDRDVPVIRNHTDDTRVSDTPVIRKVSKQEPEPPADQLIGALSRPTPTPTS